MSISELNLSLRWARHLRRFGVLSRELSQTDETLEKVKPAWVKAAGSLHQYCSYADILVQFFASVRAEEVRMLSKNFLTQAEEFDRAPSFENLTKLRESITVFMRVTGVSYSSLQAIKNGFESTMNAHQAARSNLSTLSGLLEKVAIPRHGLIEDVRYLEKELPSTEQFYRELQSKFGIFYQDLDLIETELQYRKDRAQESVRV